MGVHQPTSHRAGQGGAATVMPCSCRANRAGEIPQGSSAGQGWLRPWFGPCSPCPSCSEGFVPFLKALHIANPAVGSAGGIYGAQAALYRTRWGHACSRLPRTCRMPAHGAGDPVGNILLGHRLGRSVASSASPDCNQMLLLQHRSNPEAAHAPTRCRSAADAGDAPTRSAWHQAPGRPTPTNGPTAPPAQRLPLGSRCPLEGALCQALLQLFPFSCGSCRI